MSDTTLDTAARLTDIRLRIYNRERITPAEMRSILLDIARDRESASKLSVKARRDAKKAVSSNAATAPSIDIDSMFSIKS